ncbi:MAG: DUF2891 family protein [Phycisphaerales bacterium JB063]
MVRIDALCPGFDRSMFDGFAGLALSGVVREYPNQPGYRLVSDADLLPPREIHPSFYGCYDWHSAVHGHWLLVRLLRAGALSASVSEQAESVLRRHLAHDRLSVETAFFHRDPNAGFEWPYGWAWLFALEAEVRRWDRTAAAALKPLADTLADRVPGMLARMRAPQRIGQHGDTAFAMQLMLEAECEGELSGTVRDAAMQWFSHDQDYPWHYEQGPYDFHSPGLSVTGLMRMVLPAEDFRLWLRRFWPALFEAGGDLGPFAQPVECVDNTDGKLAHLHGLNLERARVLSRLAEVFDPDSPEHQRLGEIARRHANAGLAGVHSGAYTGEHWLATFAVRLLLGASPRASTR